MKTKFYLGALATLALSLGFTSCSSDEPLGGDQNGEATGEARYMTVNIKAAGLGSTRADGAEFDGYEAAANGSNEDKIENIYFYFFTETGAPYIMSLTNVNGTVSNTNMVKPTTFDVDYNDGNTSDASINGVLVLGTPDGGYLGNTPALVFCVINTNNPSRYAEKTLSELYTNTYSATSPNAGDDLSWDRFFMVNSTYYDESYKDVNDGSGVVYFTKVADKVKESLSEAEKDPAIIYVERVAAKIRCSGLGVYPANDKDGNQEEYNFADENNTASKKKLMVELTGWRTHNEGSAAQVIKNISAAITETPFEGWNDVLRHRSYWAYTMPAAPYRSTFDIYDTAGFLGNFDKNKPTENIRYLYPNTQASDTEPTSRTGRAPGIVVCGVVKYMNEDGTAGDPADIVYWAGTYYTYEDFREIVAHAYNKEVSEGLNEVTANAVVLTRDTNKNTFTAGVKRGEQVDDLGGRFSNILWWQDGVTSYYTKVQHFGKKVGVVRNHIYDYTFEGVMGLGVPGNALIDPDPEQETYLAARVNVLNWHVVKNSLILQ